MITADLDCCLGTFKGLKVVALTDNGYMKTEDGRCLWFRFLVPVKEYGQEKAMQKVHYETPEERAAIVRWLLKSRREWSEKKRAAQKGPTWQDRWESEGAQRGHRRSAWE